VDLPGGCGFLGTTVHRNQPKESIMKRQTERRGIKSETEIGMRSDQLGPNDNGLCQHGSRGLHRNPDRPITILTHAE